MILAESAGCSYPTPNPWASKDDGCITLSPKVKAEWLHYPTRIDWL